MTTLAANTTRPTVSARRARIIGDAVTSAYIQEIAVRPRRASVQPLLQAGPTRRVKSDG